MPSEFRNRFITDDLTLLFSRMDLGSSSDEERLRPTENTPQKLVLTPMLPSCHKRAMPDSDISPSSSTSKKRRYRSSSLHSSRPRYSSPRNEVRDLRLSDDPDPEDSQLELLRESLSNSDKENMDLTMLSDHMPEDHERTQDPSFRLSTSLNNSPPMSPVIYTLLDRTRGILPPRDAVDYELGDLNQLEISVLAKPPDPSNMISKVVSKLTSSFTGVGFKCYKAESGLKAVQLVESDDDETWNHRGHIFRPEDRKAYLRRLVDDTVTEERSKKAAKRPLKTKREWTQRYEAQCKQKIGAGSATRPLRKKRYN